ncbi:MAG TPA: DNA polymerase/3'-5' exonuclease PolX [Ardenticatenaceae bacterium]|jgi:DNA polymerase (family 10)
MAARLNNGQVAAFFDTIADLMQLQEENSFKIRAYRRAAETIRALPHDINTDYEEGTLREIPGIGDAIAAKISEIIETGRLGFLERLEGQIPAGVAAMMRVPEIGPKSARAIYKTLGIESLEALEAAARAGELRGVPGIGAKTEQRILEGIEALRRRSDRLLMGIVLPRAEALLLNLQDAVGDHLVRADLAGSLRRAKATTGNLDLLVAAEPGNVASILQTFQGLPQVGQVLDAGAWYSSVRLHSGEQADLRVVNPSRWGLALFQFTGSPAHNARVGELAGEAGLSLQVDDWLSDARGDAAFETETALYGRLGLPWIPPELREGAGEVEAARDDELPDLVELDDLFGDLHMHTSWSDGKASVLEMAQAAREFGYEYIVITDHSQSLGIANGLSPERIIEQRYEIINANAKFNDFAILQGAEVEIKQDGSLDYPDDLLAKLDVVVASMHTGIRGDRETLTQRMLNAIRNPHVDVIGHMTNRLLGRREGADLDMDAVLRAAAEHGTILEINSQVDRLDLDPTHARLALEYGCLLSVDSDAHNTDGLDVIRYGISQARRAWAELEDVINTRPLEEFLSYIKQRNE